MMNRFSLVFTTTCLLVVFGCKHGSDLHPDDYVKWIESSGEDLVKTAEIGGLEFCMTYKPVDVMILQSNEGILPDPDSLKVLREEYNGLYYFTFQMKMSDNSNVLEYEGSESSEEIRLQHFFGAMQNDFVLVEGHDTLPCVLYHYERDYGVDPFETFSIGFERKNKVTEENITVLYNDQVMRTGPMRFKFDANALELQPQLKY